MSTMPRLSLMRLEKTTQFAPLAILGAYIRQHDLISPFWRGWKFSKRLHTEILHWPDRPMDKHSGSCRSVSQVNTKIRPEHLLARRGAESSFVSNPVGAYFGCL